MLISGIGTPADAAVGPGGVIEVAQAAGSGVLSVPAGGGNPIKFARPQGLLGLAVKDLLIYVTQPSTHSVIALNPATGHTATLITGIDSPVGLALQNDGQLLIADSTSGTVAIAPTC